METRDNLIDCRLLFISFLFVIYYYIWFFIFDGAVLSGHFSRSTRFYSPFIIV